jgi:hypothetical protein
MADTLAPGGILMRICPMRLHGWVSLCKTAVYSWLDDRALTGRPRLSSRQMLKASSPALVRHEESEAPVAFGERITPEIPSSQFARIRAWVKYGMTTAQVAGVYGVAVDVIERILTKG